MHSLKCQILLGTPRDSVDGKNKKEDEIASPL